MIVSAVQWKREKLERLLKASKTSRDSSFYRSICLLNTIEKMLERIIYNRLPLFLRAKKDFQINSMGFIEPDQSMIQLITAEGIIHEKDSTSKYCVLMNLEVRNASNLANWNLIRKSLVKTFIPHIADVANSFLQ